VYELSTSVRGGGTNAWKILHRLHEGRKEDTPRYSSRYDTTHSCTNRQASIAMPHALCPLFMHHISAIFRAQAVAAKRQIEIEGSRHLRRGGILPIFHATTP